MSNDQITNLLTIILFVMLGILAILLITYIVLRIRTKNIEKKRMITTQTDANKKDTNSNISETTDYTKQSIYSFMKFDKIQDNMIITQKRKKICYGSRMSGNKL